MARLAYFTKEIRDAMKPDGAWRSNQNAHALCGLTLVGGDSGRLLQQVEFIAHDLENPVQLGKLTANSSGESTCQRGVPRSQNPNAVK